MNDFRHADIPELDRLLLGYAALLTQTPERVDDAAASALKAAGVTDRMLHDLVQVTAYFAYVNRIADGLGVELETDR